MSSKYSTFAIIELVMHDLTYPKRLSFFFNMQRSSLVTKKHSFLVKNELNID